VNALPVSDKESARRREDMLRELNLYPLWQLRVPAGAEKMTEEPAGELTIAPPVLPLQINDQIAVINPAQIDCGNMGWAELKKCVKTCTACALRAGCTQTVFGTGDEKADWLFVGSWPSEDDDLLGSPFAGQAGQLLDNMLVAIKLKRGNNVYLSNVVKCTGSIKRGPRADQIAQCSPYLMRQIQLIQPKIIVALGHPAATALLGEDREWNSLLGKVHDYCGFEKDNPQPPIPLIITHHPAALLLTPLNKAQTWRDLCLARDTMLGLVSGEA
jgi:uracil-DNA glycosylase